MDYVDFVMEYRGIGNCKSKCGVKIIKTDVSPIVIITELPDNPGTSVTNWFENIATLVYEKYLKNYDPEPIIWIEHYPPEYYNREHMMANATEKRDGVFDKVSLEWDNAHNRYVNPFWYRISKTYFETLLSCNHANSR